MTVDITSLNGQTFDELRSSILLPAGNGVTIQGGGAYQVSPNGIGLATYDNWIGTLASPDPNDIVSYQLTVADPALDVVRYTFTQANGAVNPATGGVGAVVLAWNGPGILLEQLTGYVPGNTTLNPSGQYLVLSMADLSVTDGSGGASPSQLAFGTSGPFPTFCFAAGTLIACEMGEVAVEDLVAGDMVVLAGGGTLPVIWIGQRRIDCAAHPDPESVLPIRVAPGAFGQDEPRRALFLSPDHAVFIDGVLVPIRLLVNGSSIRQVERETVTYYHVELARHAILLAEGLPAESFLDTGDRSRFDNCPPQGLYRAERSATAWECLACAPLVLTGARLDKIRRFLSARAEAQEAGGEYGQMSYSISKILTRMPAVG